MEYIESLKGEDKGGWFREMRRKLKRRSPYIIKELDKHFLKFLYN